MNMNNENERFLTQWSAKFQVSKPQNRGVPGEMPVITGQRAAPFGSIHYGFIPQNSVEFTPSQATFGGVPGIAGQSQNSRQIAPVTNRSNLREEYGTAPPRPVNRIGPFQYPSGDIVTPERRKSKVTKTPDSKKVSCCILLHPRIVGKLTTGLAWSYTKGRQEQDLVRR